MGWQDRDYARLTDDEIGAIYGAHPAIVDTERIPVRRIVWTLVAMLVTLVSVFGWHLRTPSLQVDAPAVMFGTALRSGDVCTEMEFVTATHSWRCDIIAINTAHVPVFSATPYNGQCAHMKVAGRAWICLSATPLSDATS